VHIAEKLSSVFFTCKAETNVQWSFEKLSKSNSFIQSSPMPQNAIVLAQPNGVIFLENVTIENQGVYICQWTLSKLKRISSFGTLKIKGKIKKSCMNQNWNC